MTDITRKQIVALLRHRLAAKGTDGRPLSQQAFGKAHRISGAVVNYALQGRWDLISDKMWQKLGAATGHRHAQWAAADTRDFRAMQGYLSVAQADGITLAVSHEPGCGKTFALRHYEGNHPEVYYLQCADFWSKRYFLQELYRTLGKEPGEMTCVQLSVAVITELRTKRQPLLIMDEADKLRDTTLLFVIELYNKLNGICGIVLTGAPYLAWLIEKGAARNKRGYREIYSRIGRRFVRLHGANRKDVAAICQANGVNDPAAIATIWAEVNTNKDVEVDLRRVEREVQKYHRLVKDGEAIAMAAN